MTEHESIRRHVWMEAMKVFANHKGDLTVFGIITTANSIVKGFDEAFKDEDNIVEYPYVNMDQ